VKAAFSAIWKTTDLIVSMDSLLLWKPWWHCESWTPSSEGLHLDQNPFHKPNKECIQGMLPLYDVTEVTGGLEIVPCTHLPQAKEVFKKRYPRMVSPMTGDWCVLGRDDPIQGTGKLLTCCAGDLILWDSRTVHGGHVGKGPENPSEDGPARLARLTQTICMVPREKATAAKLAKRKEAIKKGVGFTHWPGECRVVSNASSGFVPPQLTPEQLELV
jgi:ectoine hydroxylase-related dioxygenase (phytanoyl-CoA dioxygenase family)